MRGYFRFRDMRSKIKEAVKRILWDEKRGEYTIIITDRLSDQGYREIRGDSIEKITVFDQVVLKDGTVIPLHRILIVKKGESILVDRRKNRYLK